jgi:hypothetical protein
VKHQPKWRAKTSDSDTTKPWASSSEPIDEEEVSRLMGHDRAKAAVRKAKGKASSSNQSEHDPSTMGGVLFTLKKVSTTFAKVQLWKRWNELKECSTADMDEI